MTIYADVLFLMNFLFDAELLFLLCKVYSKKVPFFKILLSAAVGGIFGVLVFVPFFAVLSYPPAKVVLPMIMTAIVFLPCKSKTYRDVTLIFIGISFIISGAVNFFGLKGVFGILIPIPLYGFIQFMKKNADKTRKTVIISYKGHTCTIDGFYDSGNLLTYANSPVILGNRIVFEKLFGKGFSILALSEWAEACDIRMIPYSSLGKNGALIGIQLDYAKIGEKEFTKTILAFSGKDFSEELILNSVMI